MEYKRQLIKLECQKAFQSKGFWIALFIGMLIAGSHVWKHFFIGNYLAGEDVIQLGVYYTGSAFGQRMGMDLEIEGRLFIFLVPLLATMPYATSYSNERREGYMKQVVSRGTVAEYLWAKYIATFVSGAVVVMLPLVFDFLMITLDTPMRMPITLLSTVNPMECWVVKLYFNHPLLHTILYIGMTGLIGGSFASLALAAAGLKSSSFTVWAVPMLVALAMNYLLAPLGLAEWNPLDYLLPDSTLAFSPVAVMVECAIPLILVYILFVRKVSKEELFE